MSHTITISRQLLDAGYGAIYEWDFDPETMAMLIVNGDLAEVKRKYNPHYLHDFQWNAVLPFLLERSSNRKDIVDFLTGMGCQIFGWNFLLKCVCEGKYDEILDRWTKLHTRNESMRKKMAEYCLQSVSPKETTIKLKDVVIFTVEVLCKMSQQKWWDITVAADIVPRCIEHSAKCDNVADRSKIMVQIATITMSDEKLQKFMSRQLMTMQTDVPFIWCCPFHLTRFHAAEAKYHCF